MPEALPLSIRCTFAVKPATAVSVTEGLFPELLSRFSFSALAPESGYVLLVGGFFFASS